LVAHEVTGTSAPALPRTGPGQFSRAGRVRRPSWPQCASRPLPSRGPRQPVKPCSITADQMHLGSVRTQYALPEWRHLESAV
jgi:hypothetical protein